MDDCVFCKIVKGEISSKKEYESQNIIAIHDINPSAQVHILLIPKKHIPKFTDFTSNDYQLIGEMIYEAQKLINKFKIEKGYKVIFNGGRHQIIDHVHMHLMGGKMKKKGEDA